MFKVNGDTVFMTGNFKEFKVDDQGNSSWDERNAMANTADLLASIDNSAEAPSSDFRFGESSFTDRKNWADVNETDSDLQLAIALQQQEFEQQPQRQQTMPQQIGGGSKDGNRSTGPKD